MKEKMERVTCNLGNGKEGSPQVVRLRVQLGSLICSLHICWYKFTTSKVSKFMWSPTSKYFNLIESAKVIQVTLQKEQKRHRSY